MIEAYFAFQGHISIVCFLSLAGGEGGGVEF